MKPTQMPLVLVESIMRQAKDWKLGVIMPWGCGDPLLETRMPEIVKIIRAHNSAPICLFTNGILYENRQLLTLADRVDFTLSAATAETFEKIYQVPGYETAVKTIEWLEAQPNRPEIYLRFVICEKNLHELGLWREQWSRFPQYRNVATGPWRPSEKLDTEGELDDVARGAYDMPCLFWNQCFIRADGALMQCCKQGDKYDNINQISLLEAWQNRVRNAMNNPICEHCDRKVPDWKERLTVD